MRNKTKKMLKIIMFGFYLIITVWLEAFIYNNCLSEEYKVAYWITIIFHYLILYVIIMLYALEEEDK